MTWTACLLLNAIEWTIATGLASLVLLSPAHAVCQANDAMDLVRNQERKRAEVIQSVIGSVVAIYDEAREGGGSGVIIDRSGLALTNHHVIMGAGVSGMAGLADGKLYKWELVATDPGGDLALIRLYREDDFPFAPLADSDRIRAGDWAMAMGNPFVLADDHVPTVTLGIVSGVKRYQAGSGNNQLVYGNCIQSDSSINPGNSGGPLFDMSGSIMGINGRASFLERGRVNVGLGYAISSNQAKNFLGELMATYLVQHGTLDASFSDYTDKGILCSTINEFSDAARAGLELADRLIELEGVAVESSNQVASLLCTLPRGWPTTLRVRKPDGTDRSITVRMTGLPYQQAPEPPQVPSDPDQPKDEEQQRQADNQQKMQRLLSAGPSTVRDEAMNHFCRDVLLVRTTRESGELPEGDLKLHYGVESNNVVESNNISDTKTIEISLKADGTFTVIDHRGDAERQFKFHSGQFAVSIDPARGNRDEDLSMTQAKTEPAIVVATAIDAMSRPGTDWFRMFGSASIDGSDKANGSPSIRLKSLDAEKDWFYSWVSSGFAGGEDSVLVKAAADMDCDGKSGGVVFREWKTKSGWRVPAEIRIVKNLDEKLVETWRLKSANGEGQ